MRQTNVLLLLQSVNAWLAIVWLPSANETYCLYNVHLSVSI